MRKLTLFALLLLFHVITCQSSLEFEYPLITSTWIGMGSADPQRLSLLDSSLHAPKYSISGMAIHPLTKDLYFVSQLPQVNVLSRDRKQSKILYHSQLTPTPHSITFDSTGHLLFISDSNQHVIQQWNITDNSIINLAGINGTFGSTGNGDVATNATLYSPKGLFYDANSLRLFVVDSQNYAVRFVDLRSNVMQHFVGTYSAGNIKNTLKNETELYAPVCVQVIRQQVWIGDSSGIVVVNDTANNDLTTFVNTNQQVYDMAVDGDNLYYAQGNLINVVNIATHALNTSLFHFDALDPQGTKDGVGQSASFSETTSLIFDQEEQSLYAGDRKDLLIRKLIKKLDSPQQFSQYSSQLSWNTVPKAMYYRINAVGITADTTFDIASISSLSTTLEVSSVFGVTIASSFVVYVPPPQLTDGEWEQVWTQSNASMLTVTWNTSLNVSRMEVQLFDFSSAILLHQVNITSGNTCSFSALQSNTHYWIRLRVFDERNIFGDWSPLKQMHTYPLSPNIQVELLQSTSLFLELQMPQAGTVAISYFMVQIQNGTHSLVRQFNTTIPSVTIQDLLPDSIYYIYINSVNQNNLVSQLPSMLTITTLINDTVPMTPMNMQIIRLNRNSVNVSWEISEANTIPVDYYIFSLILNTTLITIKTNNTLVTVQGLLVPDVNYQFRVSAVSEDFGSSVPLIKLNSIRPDAPTEPQPVQLVSLGVFSMTVSFNVSLIDNGGAALRGYMIRYVNGSFQNNVFVDAIPNARVIIAQLNNLQPNTTYSIYVLSMNSYTNSPFSNVTLIKTYADVKPIAPRNLITEEVRTHSWVVSWEMPMMSEGGPLLFYYIRLTIDNQYRYIYTLDGAYTGVNFTDLYDDTDYKMEIRGVNLAGLGPYSTPITVRTLLERPTAPYDRSDLNMTIALGIGIAFLIIITAFVLLFLSALIAGVIVYWNRDKIFRPIQINRAPAGATRVYSTVYDGPVVDDTEGTHVELNNI